METVDAEKIRRAWREARLAPLWESPSAHKPPPKPVASHLWAWAALRPLLDYAIQEASPAAIERRSLQLISPAAQMPEEEFTAGNVLAAVQCLLPGESARPHRHSMGAIRFVLEGRGAETIVDGKACAMEPGDLILTPAWSWHQHRHTGTEPVLWMDALDVPLHAYLGTVEFQPGPIVDQPETMDDGAFQIPNMLPEEIVGRRDHAPVFRYPYAQASKAVAAAPPSADHVRRVRYANPLTGGPAIPVLDNLLIQIDGGRPTRPARTNANAVCLVVEGSGESKIGDEIVRWGPKDIFTIPQWNWAVHSTSDKHARIFVVSDRAVLRELKILREEVRS